MSSEQLARLAGTLALQGGRVWGEGCEQERKWVMKDGNVQLVVKGLISVLITALGVTAMALTDGETGVGWAILGLVVVWN